MPSIKYVAPIYREVVCGVEKKTTNRPEEKTIINFIGLHFNFHEVIYIINVIAYRLDCGMAFVDIVVGGGVAVELTKTTIVMDTKRLTLPIVIWMLMINPV